MEPSSATNLIIIIKFREVDRTRWRRFKSAVFQLENHPNYKSLYWNIIRILSLSIGKASKFCAFQLEKLPNFKPFSWRSFQILSNSIGKHPNCKLFNFKSFNWEIALVKSLFNWNILQILSLSIGEAFKF